MKTSEVLNAWSISNNESSIFPIETVARQHDMKLLMSLGRRLPGTKSHAQYWISNGCVFDVISKLEIVDFSKYCTKLGVEPQFEFTKSKTFVRCTNQSEINEAIKKLYA